MRPGDLNGQIGSDKQGDKCITDSDDKITY